MRFPILAAMILVCFATDAATISVVSLIGGPELTAIVSE
jgi:hypothetical protein